MKKTFLNLFVLLALFATVFSSCKDDDDDDKKPAVASGLTISGKDITNATATKDFNADGTIAFGSKVSFNAFDGETELKQVDWSVSPDFPSGVSGANGAEGSYLITVGNYELAAEGIYTLTGTAEKGSGTIKFKLAKRTATKAVAKRTAAELTGVLYAGKQYATPNTTKEVALTFVKSAPTGLDKIFFTISAGATITATPATGVMKTPATNVALADKFLPSLNIAGAPTKLGDANVWEMALPAAAGNVKVTVVAEDGTTNVEYTLKIAEAVIEGSLSVDAFKGNITKYGASEKIEISSSGGTATATATALSFLLSNQATDTKWTIAPALPATGIIVNEVKGVYSLVIANYTLAADQEYTVTGTSGGKSATRKFTLKKHEAAATGGTGDLSVVALKKDFKTAYGADETIEFSSTKVRFDADLKSLESVVFSLSDGVSIVQDATWTINPALPLTSEDSILEFGVTETEQSGFYILTIADYTLAQDTEYTVTGTSGGKSATRKFTLKASK